MVHCIKLIHDVKIQIQLTISLLCPSMMVLTHGLLH